jgi:hypothetical protein
VTLPLARILDRADAGADQRAVGKHHFHAADHLGVIAIRGVADAVLERVADHASPALRRARHPQARPAAVQLFLEIEEADAGLDKGVP